MIDDDNSLLNMMILVCKMTFGFHAIYNLSSLPPLFTSAQVSMSRKPGSAGSGRGKGITVDQASKSAAEEACTACDPVRAPLEAPLPNYYRQKEDGTAGLHGEEAKQYLNEHVAPLLSLALQATCTVRPTNPVDFLAMYLLRSNPNAPREQRGYVEVSTNPADIAPIPRAE